MTNVTTTNYESSLDALVARSLTDCHARGVESIVLSRSPMVRVFVATESHELWRNRLPLAGPMSVGLHPHHCELTLTPVLGDIYNVCEADPDGLDVAWTTSLHRFRYLSPITGGVGSFVAADCGPRAFRLRHGLLTKPVRMAAEELHSMWVPPGEVAAWVVNEGKENPAYVPDCWSNAGLNRFDFTGMYQPMSRDRLVGTLALLPSWVHDLIAV